MARMRSPAVAVLSVAAVALVLAALFVGVGRGSLGAAWATVIFLAAAVAWLVAAIVRDRAEPPVDAAFDPADDE
jgi:Na+-driven multidrug efflux pump